MSTEQDSSQPDLYEMLGIAPDAPREQVVRAWRRRARAEHPDSRPHDTAAPARFRALAEAYRVLADPDRRAAYDRAAGYHSRLHAAPPGSTPGEAPGARAGDGGGHAAADPAVTVPDVPLRAGPVWIEPASQAPAGGWLVSEDDVLADLVLRYLARWGQPW